MKQLRFTTTEPRSMFDMMSVENEVKPLVIPDTVGEFVQDNKIGKTSYIHGQAEGLAGFDIPTFIDGNLSQLEQPIENQDILMVLPSGEYKCKAEYSTHFGSENAFLITLVDEPLVFCKDYNGEYKLLVNYIISLGDGSQVVNNEILATLSTLKEKFDAEKLALVEELILDLDLKDGLPFPDDDEFIPIKNHKNFEAFKEVINYWNDEIDMDDEYEWN
jgi:hypothetical protein